jgi:hypothetical protein
MRKIALLSLALAVVLAPSTVWAGKVLDDTFAPTSHTVGIVKGGGIDNVRGKGWRSSRPVDTKVGAGHIVYDLSKVTGVREAGTLSFHLLRNDKPEHPEETLFSFVDNASNSLYSVKIYWNGFHQDAFPEIFGPTDGTPPMKSNPILFNKQVGAGQPFWLVFSWDKTGARYYLDGVELTVALVAGDFSPPGTPVERMPRSGGLRNFSDLSGNIIPKSRFLVLGTQLENGFPQITTTPLSTLDQFSIYDSAMTPGQLTGKSLIASISDDSFAVPGISGKLVAGNTVKAELVASPGGTATFDMGRVKGIAMAPVPADNGATGGAPVLPGTYRGSYTIRAGDDFVDGRVVGQFVSIDNVAADPVASPSKWTIETKPVVAFAIEKKDFSVKDLPADAGARNRIKLTAKDANGNPLQGRNIKLTLSTTDEYTGTVGAGDFGKQVGASVETRWKGVTDSWGEIEFDYVAGFAAKTVILQAKDLDSSGVSVDYITTYKEASIDIVLTAPISRAAGRRGLQYLIKVEATRTELTADGRSRSVVRATVSDPTGKPVAGDNVAFTLSSANGTLNTIKGTTDASGVATAEYIAGKKIGIVVVTATDTLRNISASVSITLLADAPAKIILKARPETMPADGNSRADISVKVTDINDNPNKDTKVEFRLSRGSGKMDYPDRVTDRFGDTLNRFTSGVTPGISTIVATVRSKVPTTAELLKARNVIFVPYNETSDSIRVEKWLKKKGDTVLLGEPIVAYTVGRGNDVRTIDAPYDLTMGETFVEYWDKAEVGQTLATVIPTVK